jgi:hypothetical protein
MMEVNPITGEKYEHGVDYYSVYKVDGKCFYVKESIEHPTDLKWDEYVISYLSEEKAKQQVDYLNNFQYHYVPIGMRRLMKWNTKLKRK